MPSVGAGYTLGVLGLERRVIAKQLRNRDGGAPIVKLYGHAERGEAINWIQGITGNRPPDRRCFGGSMEGKVRPSRVKW
jgi:hypothetical protein